MHMSAKGSLPSSSKSAVEESRRLIDQKKAELYESIRMLNSERNELAPISILPPELLAKIFSFGVDKIFLPEPRDPGFLNFTYVSQKWRNVALATPSLWDTPNLLFPAWASAMIHRSKMADLVIDAHLHRSISPALMEDIFDNHAARIRELHLRDLTSASLSLILAYTRPSSLSLRSLTLLASPLSWVPTYEDQGMLVFPANLMAQPDRLRYLEISSCSFEWYAQPHPLLTHLTVDNSPIRPLLSEFVAALAGMPALETLYMQDSLPLAKNAVRLDRKIELPKLSYLRLSSSNFFEVLNIISLLIIPCTASINLSCVELPDETAIQLPEIGAPIKVFFSSMTGSVEKNPYEQLLMYNHGDGDSVGLSAWRKEQRDSYLPDLSLTFAHPTLHAAQLLDEILPHLALSGLKTLVIDIVFGQGAIYKYFGQSTTIRTVELEANALVPDFLETLTHKQQGYEKLESVYQYVSFPALRSLHFNGIGLSSSVNLEQILDCLMERYERGAGVHELGIRNCFSFGEYEIGLLREIVADVEWDGFVQNEDSDMTDDTNIIEYDDFY